MKSLSTSELPSISAPNNLNPILSTRHNNYTGKRGNGAQSMALTQALSHVKDFMTDVQKSLIFLKEGKAAMDSYDFRGAVECYSEGISYNPIVSLFSMRASCYKMLEMHSEAYFDYSYLIKLEPENHVHYSARGLTLSKLKKLRMAIEDLDIAIQLEPNPANYYYRGIILYDFSKYELAINDFAQALSDEQLTVSNEMKQKCLFKRAQSHFEMKAYDLVVKDASSVLIIDPNNITARALLGRALKVLNDFKGAEEQLDHAILLDENQANLFTERGDIRFRTGVRNKIIESIYDFDKAVKLLESKLLSIRSGPSEQLVGKKGNRSTPSAAPSPINNHNNNSNNKNATKHFNFEIPSARSSARGSARDNLINVTIPSSLSHNNIIGQGPTPSSNSSDTQEVILQLPSTLIRREVNIKVTSNNNSKANLRVSSRGQGYEGTSSQINSTHLKEFEEQLADVLCKRAQAKLMVENDAINAESALNDAIKASAFVANDDDYQLVVATCYIRLLKYDEAIKVLQSILDRTPDNYKALYNYSFCQRANGNQRKAIESLTKIIADSGNDLLLSSVSEVKPFTHNNSNKKLQVNGPSSDSSFSNVNIPIHRVYEMRGTFFHELQVDLGRAIAINPARAENYVLRGDCQCKLGNYEQAIADYNLAQEKQFEDLASLFMSRGGVYRLLGNTLQACQDFSAALELIPPDDKVSNVRVLSFQSFCFIDQCNYKYALDSLRLAQKLNNELIKENKIIFDKEMEQMEPVAKEPETITLNALKENKFVSNKLNSKIVKKPISSMEGDYLYLHRINWILDYHIALSSFMTKDFRKAEQIIIHTLEEENDRYVPDDISRGLLYYFLGNTQLQLKKYDLVESTLQKCMKSHWINVKHNEYIYYFTMGKLYQAQKNHQLAIDTFSMALKLKPDCSYSLFKRGWSYKALGKYKEAGEDFETAKSLQPDDPNFSLDYRSISSYEYMIIETEPDLVEIFPVLLPVPGFGVSFH
eukprot:gene7639-10398_t